MHLDQQAVRACRHGGQRQRRHQRRASRRVAGIHDHRQVGHLLQHRDDTDIQRRPAGLGEAADAPLTQHHIGIAAGEDVLRRLQQFLHRGAHGALQQHRLGLSAQGAQQLVVLHVPGAHLQHVHMLELGQLGGVGDLRHGGQAHLLSRLGQQLQRRRAEALEGVGRGAGLIGAAPQHHRAGGLDRPGHGLHLEGGFNGAGARHQAEASAADGYAAHGHHRVLRMVLAGGQTPHRGQPLHVRHMGQRQQVLLVQRPGGAHQRQQDLAAAVGPCRADALAAQLDHQRADGRLRRVFFDENQHICLRKRRKTAGNVSTDTV